MTTLRNLPALVRERFQAAQKSEDLTFYPTKVAVLHYNGLPFQVRFSPSLANKPKGDKPSKSSSPPKPLDPFASPPPALFITFVPPSHYLVLNKFPVIPDHFILATKEFKNQTELLEEGDLQAAWECLKAFRECGEEAFGFFNSGEYSGASQRHRHLQFLTFRGMRSGLDDREAWGVLADRLLDREANLPFVYFASRIPEDVTPERLHGIYAELYGKALDAAKKYVAKTKDDQLLTQKVESDESALSYNIGLTDRVMVLFPRISEGLTLKSDAGEEIGSIALNGTILGGTLLVKNESEWDALRSDASQLGNILKAIGIPKNVDVKLPSL